MWLMLCYRGPIHRGAKSGFKLVTLFDSYCIKDLRSREYFFECSIKYSKKYSRSRALKKLLKKVPKKVLSFEGTQKSAQESTQKSAQ